MLLMATERPKRESIAREVIGWPGVSERVHQAEVGVPVVAQVEVKASEPSRR